MFRINFYDYIYLDIFRLLKAFYFYFFSSFKFNVTIIKTIKF